MNVRVCLIALLVLTLSSSGFVGLAPAGQDGLPENGAITGSPGAIPPVRFSLDGLAKDLDLSFLTSPGQSMVRLPLTPGDWSLLGGVQPYVLFTPSALRSTTAAEPGLTAAAREPSEDPRKGLGLGAGFEWHLSDRLDLFGQYQFTSQHGGNATTGNPFTRREIENPGVKAGFSIHF